MKALIVGVTGQDGSYLAELLVEKGYEVHGIKRRSSSFNTDRVDDLYLAGNLHLHYGDLTDATSLIRLLQEIKPDEIYNLGAQSHVKVSFETPEYTAQTDALGTLRLLEAIRILGMTRDVRFFQASTSEMFGDSPAPQSETTPFRPRSPYAAAKLYAHWMVVNYREAYRMHASCGILFNHESPRRGETFVTRKVTRAVAEIACGKHEVMHLGNLNARRDWGYAQDYVEAMWLMLQQDSPDDMVIATGKSHSVRDLVETAFRAVSIEVEWDRTGIDEIGVNSRTGDVLVCVDQQYFRPTEVDFLLGDARKAAALLGWKPKWSFTELVELMVSSDIAAIIGARR